MGHTYDEIYELVSNLEAPTTADCLKVEWLLENKLALGKDSENRSILVLAGAHIDSSKDSIRKAMLHDHWRTEAGETLQGSLIRLHEGEEFLVATTTIATELLKKGLDHRPINEVFLEVENFIELVIRRILLPPETMIGLLGELIVIDTLIDSINSLDEPKKFAITSVWQGFTTDSRDFRINKLGLEVKTTTHDYSEHHIGSLNQIEARNTEGEDAEILRLISIGLKENSGVGGRFSIASMTTHILDKLSDEEQGIFLKQLSQYGPDDCMGYDHELMSEWEVYQRSFSLTFSPRVYDLTDPNVLILRRSMFDELLKHMFPERISFMIKLPDEVPGSYGNNPKVNLNTELVRLLNLNL